MEYQEEDFLLLSGIQHFAFCRRQWALIHVEQQWEENVRTFEGRSMHEKAHDPFIKEKRGNIIIFRAMKVFSRTMGISGECDVVEFHKAESGISLAGREGFVDIFLGYFLDLCSLALFGKLLHELEVRIVNRGNKSENLVGLIRKRGEVYRMVCDNLVLY